MMKKVYLLAMVTVALFIAGCGGSAEPQRQSQSWAKELVEKNVSKQGFLTTDYCLARDYFTNCRLENYKNMNQELVLYVHDELGSYVIDASGLEKREMDEGFARDGVTITGDLYKAGDKMVIVGHEYKGPPPPSKSFFKGCL